MNIVTWETMEKTSLPSLTSSGTLQPTSTLPRSSHWILRDYSITCDNDHVVCLRLSNEEAVKRITMYLRKLLYPFECNRANPQYPYVALMALHFQLWNRHIELEFANALLYGYLPE